MSHPFASNSPPDYDTTARSSAHGAIFFICTMDHVWKRVVGLMFRKDLPSEIAYLFPNTKSVHTFGMRFALDIVFLNKHKKVIAISHDVGRFRVRIGPIQTDSILEMKAGSAKIFGVTLGSNLSLRRLAKPQSLSSERRLPLLN